MYKTKNSVLSSVLFLSAIFLVVPLAHAAEPVKPTGTSVPTLVKGKSAEHTVAGTKTINAKSRSTLTSKRPEGVKGKTESIKPKSVAPKTKRANTLVKPSPKAAR